jgi:hypothetical protein
MAEIVSRSRSALRADTNRRGRSSRTEDQNFTDYSFWIIGDPSIRETFSRDTTLRQADGEIQIKHTEVHNESNSR